MATQMEREIVQKAEGDVDRLRELIDSYHKNDEEIAAPHDDLLDAARAAVERGSDVGGIFGEVVRGHAYAYFLSERNRAKHWKYFVNLIAQL